MWLRDHLFLPGIIVGKSVVNQFPRACQSGSPDITLSLKADWIYTHYLRILLMVKKDISVVTSSTSHTSRPNGHRNLRTNRLLTYGQTSAELSIVDYPAICLVP